MAKNLEMILESQLNNVSETVDISYQKSIKGCRRGKGRVADHRHCPHIFLYFIKWLLPEMGISQRDIKILAQLDYKPQKPGWGSKVVSQRHGITQWFGYFMVMRYFSVLT